MSTACPRCGIHYPPARFPSCPTCLLEADLPEAMLGDRLELLEEIGRGGMGSVWKARHRTLGRTVAVKFLAAELGDDPVVAGRFEREAQALARLAHPGIVAVHDFGHDEGRQYIVMEYVEGRPLGDRLPLSLAEARAVALDVLDALHYAHSQGVVHRDIKPQNILWTSDGRAKVTDFGIAGLLGASPAGGSLTRTGHLVGTPAYMAPEALGGAPADPRMDVFSVGVLLHEMLTGHRPGGEIARMPGGLDRIVRRAVAADPAARYASAAEMRTDLTAVGTGGTAEALSSDERSWRDGVALLLSLATAVGLWAVLLSVTPRVSPADTMPPLIALHTVTLPDGRVASRARFETWPTLAAVAALALAIGAQGLLRRHWRQAALDRPQPDRPLVESGRVLAIGIGAVTLYGTRLMSAGAWPIAESYVPILGGLLELVAVFLVWSAVLEAWRTARPLRREWRLWLGAGLALVPPVVDLLGHLAVWQP